MMRRQVLVRSAGALAMSFLSGVPALAATPLPPVEVFKNPSCGCCGAWVDHLKQAGFQVKVTEVSDTAVVRKQHGLAEKFGSCHTAIVAGYVIEGHVPAKEIKRLLVSRITALGLAVPGMPVGSPGMESGGHQDAYQVLLIDKQGRDRVFASYPQTPRSST
ncbi:MAG: DUF411 domain-containing protein [Betaproteobacteria bacterium]|jgi:hypothetical protein|nr:DUF411 domain-containing protein [Betaproteobacteria bacterium]